MYFPVLAVHDGWSKNISYYISLHESRPGPLPGTPCNLHPTTFIWTPCISESPAQTYVRGRYFSVPSSSLQNILLYDTLSQTRSCLQVASCFQAAQYSRSSDRHIPSSQDPSAPTQPSLSDDHVLSPPLPLADLFFLALLFFSQVGLQAGPAAGSGGAGNTIRGVACPPRAKEWVTVIWEMRLFRLLDYAQLWAKALLSAGNAFQKVAFRGLRPQNINTTTLLPVVLLSSKCFNSGLSYAWFGLVRCRWRLRNQLPWQHWTDC